MGVGANGVEAEHLPGHLKAGDLFTAVHGQYAGLEKPCTHGVERAQRICGAIQRSTFFTLTRCGISVSRRPTSRSVRPMGKHSSKTLQLAQVVFKCWTCTRRGVDFIAQASCTHIFPLLNIQISEKDRCKLYIVEPLIAFECNESRATPPNGCFLHAPRCEGYSEGVPTIGCTIRRRSVEHFRFNHPDAAWHFIQQRFGGTAEQA